MLHHAGLPRMVPWAVAATLLAGCTNFPTRPAPLVDYQPESFNAKAYSHRFDARAPRVCEAARRALLSQGYIVNSASADQVSARKYFQPASEQHVQLEFRVVCVTEDAGRSSMVFVNGLKDHYVVRKARESASVGVGGIGSVSLPMEGSMDSMVKVGSETVTDPQLYERFFNLTADYLAHAVSEAEVPEPPASAASAAPPAKAETQHPPPPTVVILQPGPWGVSPGAATGTPGVSGPMVLPMGVPLPAASAPVMVTPPAAPASAASASVGA